MYKMNSSNLPIYECAEKDLKGFTTTEKDKKRQIDRMPISHFRNFKLDLFEEDNKQNG